MDLWAAGGARAIAGMPPGLHLGMLLAIAMYFWRDVGDMAQGLIRISKGKRDPAGRLIALLVLSSLPMIGAVVAVRYWGAVPWHTPMVMAWAAFAITLLLPLFDRACMTVKRIEHAGYSDALLLGCVQACAIVPGVGRIAAIIALARALGYERRDAARFAFLISIPTLIGAAGWNIRDLVTSGGVFPTNMVLLGALVGVVITLPLLAMLMAWLRRGTFTPFAVYRLIMSVNLLAFAYGWI